MVLNKKLVLFSILSITSTLYAFNFNKVKSVNDIISPNNRYVAGWKNNNPIILDKKVKIVKTINKKVILIEKPIVFFDFNKTNVKDKYKALIKEIAKYMKKRKNTYIILKGYTDNVGSQKYNFNLALQRVNNVKKLLIKEGVPKNRIVIYSFGKKYPLNNQEQKLNRRVEIFITHY